MTDPQQKEVDELIEQLNQELECCEGCPDRQIPELCDCCGTHGIIKDLEMMIEDITGYAAKQ